MTSTNFRLIADLRHSPSASLSHFKLLFWLLLLLTSQPVVHRASGRSIQQVSSRSNDNAAKSNPRSLANVQDNLASNSNPNKEGNSKAIMDFFFDNWVYLFIGFFVVQVILAYILIRTYKNRKLQQERLEQVEADLSAATNTTPNTTTSRKSERSRKSISRSSRQKSSPKKIKQSRARKKS